MTVDSGELGEALQLLKFWRDRLSLLPTPLQDEVMRVSNAPAADLVVVRARGAEMLVLVTEPVRALVGNLRARLPSTLQAT